MKKVILIAVKIAILYVGMNLFISWYNHPKTHILYWVGLTLLFFPFAIGAEEIISICVKGKATEDSQK